MRIGILLPLTLLLPASVPCAWKCQEDGARVSLQGPLVAPKCRRAVPRGPGSFADAERMVARGRRSRLRGGANPVSWIPATSHERNLKGSFNNMATFVEQFLRRRPNGHDKNCVRVRFRPADLGLKHDGPRVTSVAPGGQASMKGVQPGWVMQDVAGERTEELDWKQLYRRIEILKVSGKSFTITFDKRLDLSAKADELARQSKLESLRKEASERRSQRRRERKDHRAKEDNSDLDSKSSSASYYYCSSSSSESASDPSDDVPYPYAPARESGDRRGSRRRGRNKPSDGARPTKAAADSAGASVPKIEYGNLDASDDNERQVEEAAVKLFRRYPGTHSRSLRTNLSNFLHDLVVERRSLTIDEKFKKDPELKNQLEELLDLLCFPRTPEGRYFRTQEHRISFLERAGGIFERSMNRAMARQPVRKLPTKKPASGDALKSRSQSVIASLITGEVRRDSGREPMGQERARSAQPPVAPALPVPATPAPPGRRAPPPHRSTRHQPPIHGRRPEAQSATTDPAPAARSPEPTTPQPRRVSLKEALVTAKKKLFPVGGRGESGGRDALHSMSHAPPVPNPLPACNEETPSVARTADGPENAPRAVPAVAPMEEALSATKEKLFPDRDRPGAATVPRLQSDESTKGPSEAAPTAAPEKPSGPLSLLQAIKAAKSKAGVISAQVIKTAIKASKAEDRTAGEELMSELSGLNEISRHEKELEMLVDQHKHLEPKLVKLAFMRNRNDSKRTLLLLREPREIELLSEELSNMERHRKYIEHRELPLNQQFAHLDAKIIDIALQQARNDSDEARILLSDPKRLEMMKWGLDARLEIEEAERTQNLHGLKVPERNEDPEAARMREFNAKFNWLNLTLHPITTYDPFDQHAKTRADEFIVGHRKNYTEHMEEKAKAELRAKESGGSNKEHGPSRLWDDQNHQFYDEPTDQQTEDDISPGAALRGAAGVVQDDTEATAAETADEDAKRNHLYTVPAESRNNGLTNKALEVIFQYFDENQDGRWQFPELQKWFREMENVTITKQRYDDLCSRLACSAEDGLLWENFQQLYSRLNIDQHYAKVLKLMHQDGYLQDAEVGNLLDEQDYGDAEKKEGVIDALKHLIDEGVTKLQFRLAFKIDDKGFFSKNRTVNIVRDGKILGRSLHTLTDTNSSGIAYAEIPVDVRTLYRDLWQFEPRNISIEIQNLAPSFPSGIDSASRPLYKAEMNLPGFLTSTLKSVFNFILKSPDQTGTGEEPAIAGQAMLSGHVKPFVSLYTRVTSRKRFVTGYSGKTVSKTKATFIEFDSFPQDVAVDRGTQDVFILDSVERGTGSMIYRVTPDKSRIPLGVKGLPKALALCVDSKGQIYVSVTLGVRRIRFSRNATLEEEEGKQVYPVLESEDYPGVAPLGIACDDQDRVYVVDSNDGTVKRLDFEARQWNPATSRLYNLRNPRLNEKGEFFCPYGIAFDHDGKLVAASINQIVRTDLRVGAPVEILAEKSDLNTTFHHRKRKNKHGAVIRQAGIAVGRDREIVVTDSLRHAVWSLEETGEFHVLAGREPKGANFSRGSQNGMGKLAKFNMPSGITADGSGSFILCDMRNYGLRRIRFHTESFFETVEGEHLEHDEEEIPMAETEALYDKKKMKPEYLSYLMRRPQKPPEETKWRKLKRRKERRKERERLGVGYTDLPDEIRTRVSYPAPEPGSTRYNEELNRVEMIENYKPWR